MKSQLKNPPFHFYVPVSPQVVGLVTIGSCDDAADKKAAYGSTKPSGLSFSSRAEIDCKGSPRFLIAGGADDCPCGGTNQKSDSGSLHEVFFLKTY